MSEPAGPPDHQEDDEAAADTPVRRSVGVGVAVGALVALAATAIGFSLVAIPVFTLASTEPERGLDRPLIRDGLFRLALPVGLVLGIAAGVLVGIWYARGGRLPTDRTPT